MDTVEYLHNTKSIHELAAQYFVAVISVSYTTLHSGIICWETSLSQYITKRETTTAAQ